jgi:hypothetical protein
MSIKSLKNYDISIFALIIFIIASRVIPHPHNFTPIISFATMGYFLFKNQTKTIILTFIIMITSDLILGFYENVFYVYGSLFFIIIFFSQNKKYNYQNILIKGLLGSLIFFISTNFCVWVFEDIYSKDLAGLLSCYFQALPFLENTLISTILFNYIIFFIFKKRLTNFS